MTTDIIASERTDTDIRSERDERTPYEVHVDGDNEDSSMFMCCKGWDGSDFQATICGFNRSSAESRDDVTYNKNNTEETNNQTNGFNTFMDSAIQCLTSTKNKEFENPGEEHGRQNFEEMRIIESAKPTETNTAVMASLDSDLFVDSVRKARYESFKFAIDAASHTYGPSSLQVAELYANLGTELLCSNSNDSTSKQCSFILFEEAFHIFQTKCGDSDGRTIDMKIRLGQSSFAIGRYNDALKYFCQAVYMREALLGELHPSVSDVWVMIAEVHQQKKKMEMALRANAKALTGYRNAHGDKHVTVINVLKTIAALHIDMGNHDKAEEINKYVSLHAPKT